MKRLIFIGFLALTGACYRGHGLSPTGSSALSSGISGRITFTGTWPDSTREVRVAVLRSYPQGMTQPDSLVAFVIMNLASASDTIPRNTRSYDYQLALEPGIYAWVLVAWFPDIPVSRWPIRTDSGKSSPFR